MLATITRRALARRLGRFVDRLPVLRRVEDTDALSRSAYFIHTLLVGEVDEQQRAPTTAGADRITELSGELIVAVLRLADATGGGDALTAAVDAAAKERRS